MHAHTYEKYHKQIFCFLFSPDHIIVIYKTKSKDMYHTCMHTHIHVLMHAHTHMFTSKQKKQQQKTLHNCIKHCVVPQGYSVMI